MNRHLVFLLLSLIRTLKLALAMKLLLSILLGLIPLALAKTSSKSVIVTFPDGTPPDVIKQAEDALVAEVCLASFMQLD